MRLEIIPPLLCYLLDPLQIRTDDKFCGVIPGSVEIVVLRPRIRCDNYLYLPRENVSGNTILHKIEDSGNKTTNEPTNHLTN